MARIRTSVRATPGVRPDQVRCPRAGDTLPPIPYGPRPRTHLIGSMAQGEISTTTRDGLPPGQRRPREVAVSIAVAISVLVGSIANVALPTIARDLGVTPADVDLGGQRLPARGHRLPDAARLPGRRLWTPAGLCLGAGALHLGSLFCALAPSLSVLIAARVLQGFGGAGIMSVNGALVRFIFPRAHSGEASAIISRVAASSAAGPSIAAGSCRSDPGPGCLPCRCRWARCVLLSLRFLPRSPTPGHRFDPVSALLNAFTLGLSFRGWTASAAASCTHGPAGTGDRRHRRHHFVAAN